MFTLTFVGTGYLADLYMRFLKIFGEVNFFKAYDINSERLMEFCDYWKVSPASSLDDVLGIGGAEKTSLVMNLTNPHVYYRILLSLTTKNSFLMFKVICIFILVLIQGIFYNLLHYLIVVGYLWFLMGIKISYVSQYKSTDLIA